MQSRRWEMMLSLLLAAIAGVSATASDNLTARQGFTVHVPAKISVVQSTEKDRTNLTIAGSLNLLVQIESASRNSGSSIDLPEAKETTIIAEKPKTLSFRSDDFQSGTVMLTIVPLD